MPDRGKVIKGLEICVGESDFSLCVKEKCPYIGGSEKGNCITNLERDALALLKEQEEETRFIYDDYYDPKCEKCGFKPFVGYIPTIEWMKNRGFKKCPHCGRSVKWYD